MSRIVTISLFAVLSIGLIVSISGSEEKHDLAGVYACTGTSPGGRSYRAIVTIVGQGNVYRLRWTFAGERGNLGIGIVHGNTLSVSYHSGRSNGIVVYDINESKELVGEWTVVGADGVIFKETLKKLPASYQGEQPRSPQPRSPQPRSPQPRDRGVPNSESELENPIIEL